MKIRTAKYIVKEGLINTYRNKLMSLASFIIITATLMVLGFFYMAIINVTHNMKGLQNQPEIQVFCIPELDDGQVKAVEDTIKKDARVKSYTVVTKKEALAKASKQLLGDRADLIEGIDESFMPVSYIIKLNKPKDSKAVSKTFEGMPNLVEKVTSPQKAIDMISVLTNWIPVIFGFLFLVLFIISIFIISNTIKLTVFARRREINIMKYIGATDWFIRWPFVVEGVIIGLLGAAAAFIFVGISYGAIVDKFNRELLNTGNGIIQLVSLGTVHIYVIIAFGLLGAVVGALGSGISIRKHLHV